MIDNPEPAWLSEGDGGDVDEAFAVQVLRYLDGLATPQDLSELKEGLARHPSRRTTFVRLCRLHGELTELLAPERAALRASEASPSQSAPGTAVPAETRGRADTETAVQAAGALVTLAQPPGGETPLNEQHPAGDAAPASRDRSEETTFLARDADTQH